VKISGKYGRKVRLTNVLDGIKVVSFDGTKLRKFYPDLIGGSHHRVDKIVPVNAIWIEQMRSRDEERFLLAHEMTEYLLMKYRHWTYDPAHRIATKVEQKLRNGLCPAVVFYDFVRTYLHREFPSLMHWQGSNCDEVTASLEYAYRAY